MKFIKLIPLLCTQLLLFSCSANTASNSAPQMPKITASQIQQQWQLVGIDGQPVNTRISSTLTVSAANKATGNLACNYFFGTLQIHNNRLKIDKMGSTRKMCPHPNNEVESIVAAILSNWSKVQVDGKEMTLIGKAHRLHYQAQQSP